VSAPARGRSFTRENVLRWMRLHVDEYGTETELAEAAAEVFEVNDVPGPLDDEQHWIWEVAVDAKEKFASAPSAFSRDPFGRPDAGGS
jgi:hypothetical protein